MHLIKMTLNYNLSGWVSLIVLLKKVIEEKAEVTVASQ